MAEKIVKKIEIIMKKYIGNLLLIVICFILMGCSKMNCADIIETDSGFADNGEFKGIVSDLNLELENDENIASKDVVINEKLALEIGNAVIKSTYSEDVIKQTEFFVYEIEDRDMFLVSRIQKGGETLGGDYNVVISKKDGAILKVWSGE